MKKLKITYTEIYKVKKTYCDEFDLSDSVKWKSLLDKARKRNDCDFFLKVFPTEPSENLEDWLHLYHFLNADEYTQKVEVNDESGDEPVFEQLWSIQKQDGSVLIEDWF